MRTHVLTQRPLLKAAYASLLLTLLCCGVAVAQQEANEAAIRRILKTEVETWNKGDAEGYSRDFAENGTFTNIRGMFFTGHKEFLDRHEEIFKGMFRGTVLQQEVVSLRFVHPSVAVVETLTWISGFPHSIPPPDMHLDAKGRLRTRLLQVFAKEKTGWKIVVYHNVDVKPTTSTPEPK